MSCPCCTPLVSCGPCAIPNTISATVTTSTGQSLETLLKNPTAGCPAIRHSLPSSWTADRYLGGPGYALPRNDVAGCISAALFGGSLSPIQNCPETNYSFVSPLPYWLSRERFAAVRRLLGDEWDRSLLRPDAYYPHWTISCENTGMLVRADLRRRTFQDSLNANQPVPFCSIFWDRVWAACPSVLNYVPPELELVVPVTVVTCEPFLAQGTITLNVGQTSVTPPAYLCPANNYGNATVTVTLTG
jgi:hypothetical protein